MTHFRSDVCQDWHGCSHNQRTRFTNGFYCNDCDSFFPNSSSTYRATELLDSISMVLHNINAKSIQDGTGSIPCVLEMKRKIDARRRGCDYGALILEAEAIMESYGVNAESVTLALRFVS